MREFTRVILRNGVKRRVAFKDLRPGDRFMEDGSVVVSPPKPTKFGRRKTWGVRVQTRGDHG